MPKWDLMEIRICVGRQRGNQQPEEWLILPLQNEKLEEQLAAISGEGEFTINDWWAPFHIERPKSPVETLSTIHQLNELAEELYFVSEEEAEQINFLTDYCRTPFKDALENCHKVKIYRRTTTRQLAESAAKKFNKIDVDDLERQLRATNGYYETFWGDVFYIPPSLRPARKEGATVHGAVHKLPHKSTITTRQSGGRY
ncbi:MAG: hypothetical protein HQK58_01880 [Deltaproteobacteria bacterium]|nr:hypothetical protein [Deltaproteobacteria bacterium]